MRWTSALALCLGYALYLILGGVMFMYLQYEERQVTDVVEPPQWTRIKEIAQTSQPPPNQPDEVHSLAMWIPKACGAVSNRTVQKFITSMSEWSSSQHSKAMVLEEVEAACPHFRRENTTTVIHYEWSFIDALYFSMTVTTTIGYGFHSPSNATGQVMCILYSLIGIPLTGIFLAWTSEIFGELLFRLFKSKINKEKQYSRLMIALATFFYIMMGFVVFIFLPAVVFMVLEKWSYLESVYFSYITLTTIGFGDLVTGGKYEGASLYVYQIGVIIWIMVGLGYWLMVASFITKALKSKRLHNSFQRSANEMKKLMHQMGIKENPNHDPTFLREHSKATLNLMMQLSNMLAVQGGAENNDTEQPDDDTTATTSTGPSSPSSPPVSPLSIPGISTLFGPGLSRVTPLSHMMGPMRTEFIAAQTPPSSPVIESMSKLNGNSHPSTTTITTTLESTGGGDTSDLPNNIS